MKNKYRAIRVKHAGFSFASKLEAALYNLLLLRERAGELRDIQCQDHVYLTDARILYIPDFRYFDLRTNEHAWAEAKGYASDRWPTIKKLWKYYGPGALEIYMGSYKKIYLDDTLIPKQTGGKNENES